MKLFKVAATKHVFANTSDEAIERVIDIEHQIDYKALTLLDDNGVVELIRFVEKLRENQKISREDFEHILQAYITAKDVQYDEDILVAIGNMLTEKEQ